MVLAGTFLWSKLATALASLGIILAAAYMLWMVQRVAFGVPVPETLPKLRDVTVREMATLTPLVILVFVIGLFPNPMLSRMHASVEKVIARTSVSAYVQASDESRPTPGARARAEIPSTADPIAHQAMTVKGGHP